ncbi:MAG: hypothetical protein HY556_07185 [Euryarchaeota archaeon]|nr:hypothetical protein [Euryarchaeota archaeon]
MGTRVFRNMRELRAKVRRVCEADRVVLSLHARRTHPELLQRDKIDVVRYGERDRPAANRPPDSGVYVCWTRLRRHGLCRGVYAIVRSGHEEFVLVITAFPEGHR